MEELVERFNKLASRIRERLLDLDHTAISVWTFYQAHTEPKTSLGVEASEIHHVLFRHKTLLEYLIAEFSLLRFEQRNDPSNQIDPSAAENLLIGLAFLGNSIVGFGGATHYRVPDKDAIAEMEHQIGSAEGDLADRFEEYMAYCEKQKKEEEARISFGLPMQVDEQFEEVEEEDVGYQNVGSPSYRDDVDFDLGDDPEKTHHAI